MIKITEENVKDITFDGIIVQVPKPECTTDIKIGIIFECSYFSKGEHGYPKKGHKPDNSSFYTAYYDTKYLPNGLQFNSTSRFNLEHAFGHMDLVDYYKFENMEEFCEWYLDKEKPNKQKKTRRELLKDVIKYIEYNDKINSLRELQVQCRHGGAMDSREGYIDITRQLQNIITELDNWLGQDV